MQTMESRDGPEYAREGEIQSHSWGGLGQGLAGGQCVSDLVDSSSVYFSFLRTRVGKVISQESGWEGRDKRFRRAEMV